MEIEIGKSNAIELELGKSYPKLEIKNHYIEGKNLIIILSNGSKLSLDISEYITENLTEEQIKAINNMTVLIENGELIIEYDDEVLNLNFNLENGNLIVDNNVNGLNFNINTNEELEAIY